MKEISILGCGWLGLPLASSLVEKGYKIKGSTTSSDKHDLFLKNGIHPYTIELNENEIVGSIDSFLNTAEVLIIAIPPKLRKTNAENFVSKIKLLIPHLEHTQLTKILFISSTSVYGDQQIHVDENSPTMPETESGKQLLEVEQLLQSKWATTVLRFGGLIGPNRNPVYQLAGQKNIENPDAPVNLIHLNDCLEVIHTLLKKECWGTTFNAVAPQHPSRKEYYTYKARSLGLPLPEFQLTNTSKGKIVQSKMLTELLDYSFTTEI